MVMKGCPLILIQKSLKQFEDAYTQNTQNNVLNKVILLKLRCCSFGDLGVFVVVVSLFYSFPYYLLVVFIFILNGCKVACAPCGIV